MKLQIDKEDIRPIIEIAVSEALRKIEGDRSRIPRRLGYLEAEAAALLGVKQHVLRDARLNGEIEATKIGGRIGYEHSELLAYLSRNRLN